MKGLWAIAVDELRSKRALLMGMLALGALPWAAPFFPGLHRFDAADVRSAFMILVGLSLPPALGLGLGASVVGEEIGGRRLGFYFARPIGAWAIWGGKMLVALLVPLLAALVVFIPGAIVLLPGKRELAVALAAAAALSALLCGLAHVGAGLYRTRSPCQVRRRTIASTARSLALPPRLRGPARADGEVTVTRSQREASEGRGGSTGTAEAAAGAVGAGGGGGGAAAHRRGVRVVL
jgi:hypothetical protein